MIYLDAAATTLEKPPQVRQAMAQAAAELSTPGRGSHPAARRAEETAFRCRAEAAALFGVPSPENVVFTMNATHGLNIAIRSLVAPGSRVVISGYEHNAVCRPLYAIPEVRLTVVDAPPFRREQAAEEFRRAILAGADAVIVNHVSNVFGCVQPLEEQGWQVVNIDATLVAQAPKIAPYRQEMRCALARTLGIRPEQVNVKATTEEHLGFTGEGLGISAHAVALIQRAES